jgi:hypothetical protein
MKRYSIKEALGLEAFLKQQEALPFPFLESYARYIDQAGLGDWKLCASADQLTFMPIRQFQSRFLNIIQILHPPLNNAQRLDKQGEKAFLEAFLKQCTQERWADRICQPPTHVVFQSAPDHSLSAAFGTWYLPLEERTEEELWNGLHGKHRNVIRNAQKHQVTVKEGSEQLPVFYDLFKNTMNRSGMAAEPLSELQQLWECLGPRHLICAVAYYQDKALGAVLMPFSHFGAYYVYGASASEPEINGAVNYLHWFLILKMKREGIRRYDFVGARLSSVEGSRLAGIQQFKSRFGCTLEQGIIWKANIHKLRCRLYDFLLKILWKWKGIKWKGDIIDQEMAKSGE